MEKEITKESKRIEPVKYIHYFKISEFGSKNKCYIANAKTGIYGLNDGNYRNSIAHSEEGEVIFIALDWDTKKKLGSMKKVGDESVNFIPES